MKTENQTFRVEGESFEKRTDYMTNLKLKSFRATWNKKMLKFTFR